METIIKKFSVEAIKNFFWNKLPNFSGTTEDFTYILKENEKFSELEN